MDIIKFFSHKLNNVLIVIASVFLLATVFLIVGNAISREIFIPFKGTSEVVGWFSATVVTLSVGYAQEHFVHIKLDILSNILPKKLNKLNDLIVQVVNALFFSAIFYFLIKYISYLKEKNIVSETLSFPYYPFIFLIALGFFSLALTFVCQFIETVTQKGE